MPELAKAFDAADEVLISEIYPARESIKDATISSKEVVDAIRSSPPQDMGRVRERLKNIRLVKNKNEALNILKAEAKPGDVVVVMAVGDFNRLAYKFTDQL